MCIYDHKVHICHHIGEMLVTPESYYNGKKIAVTGLITSYEGVSQIEVTTPSQIQLF